MKAPRAPRLDTRRTKEFRAELLERARAWIPSWSLGDDEEDFGRALIDIAARFNAEVAERLDNAGEKMRRGLLDWLGVRGEAARPARMPVVFRLADRATEAVHADRPVRLQADADGVPVVFETEKDVRIVPGKLAHFVAVDPDRDAFYLPGPGLHTLEPIEPVPTQWLVKSFAPAGALVLQLDPDTGLAPDMILDVDGAHHRVLTAEKDLVTIDPPLRAEANPGSVVRLVSTFAPFDGKAPDRQEHALYLGHEDVLNIETPALISVTGARELEADYEWQYWGTKGNDDAENWRRLSVTDEGVPGAARLKKDAGAIIPRDIGQKKSRWIRAFRKNVGPNDRPFTANALGIVINGKHCTTANQPHQRLVDCPPVEKSPEAEGMANTTPLVLDTLFFPLGREPRQFDAFYLGSQEAFSKKGAHVQLCFDMAEPTFKALSAVREGLFANRVLAGVGKDRALHLFGLNPITGALGRLRQRDALQPPRPAAAGGAGEGATVALDAQPAWRLPTWGDGDGGFFVAVAAGRGVWVWHENKNSTRSGWLDFGTLNAPDGTTIDALVHLANPSQLVALAGDGIYVRTLPNGSWSADKIATKVGNASITLTTLVPVFPRLATGALNLADPEKLVGVSGERVYNVGLNGACSLFNGLATLVRGDVAPVAIEAGANDLVVVAAKKQVAGDNPFLVRGRSNVAEIESDLDTGTVVGPLDLAMGSTLESFNVLATVADSSAGTLATWAPFAAPPMDRPFPSAVSTANGEVGGGVTALAGHVIVPGSHADVLVSAFNPADRFSYQAKIEAGVVFPDAVVLAAQDVIVRRTAAGPDMQTITDGAISHQGASLYSLASKFTSSAVVPLLAYDRGTVLQGIRNSPTELVLAPAGAVPADDTWLLIGGDIYNVDSVSGRVATITNLTTQTGGASDTATDYVVPSEPSGRITSFMRLDASGNGDWKASLLERTKLFFLPPQDTTVGGVAFLKAGDKPTLVVLSAPFDPPFVGNATFLLDAALGDWHRELGDNSANPELSWEYSDGNSWSKLNVTLDETLNLKSTGAIRFRVPDDIAPSDWSGKTNFWIRARLIGGDYGKEKVTVTTKPIGGGATEQTIDRSTDGILAPSVLSLHIVYALCDPVAPTYVLTQDNGSFRDQSEANRAGAAVIEAFVPLAVMLARLTDSGVQEKTRGRAEPHDCGCCENVQEVTAVPVEPSTSHQTSGPKRQGRAVFVGVSAPPSDAPVNLLFLVTPRELSSHAPLTVRALSEDIFTPVVAHDGTYALGESAVLSMAFAEPPVPRMLFGKSLSWLKLTPATADAPWTPSIQGAYLNAVFARAAETLTRELIGSSDGAPDMVFRLARRPVLHKTLELRVREQLTEEERVELRRTRSDRVRSAVENLSGDWVLWDQVDDPLDHEPTERCYALDETTGEIRFGDGIHGMIPPIGRDAIVAFSYERTEPGAPGSLTVPGNTIEARTALNLVAPLPGVEAVVAADHSAGGAPPESSDRVVHFGFDRVRHRRRAVTVDDLEDLALQSSPDVVQAHARVRNGILRLTIVMRGANPVPSAAQVRELRAHLLAAAPPALAERDAFRIGGPRVRRLRVSVELRVDSLDNAGDVGADVRKRLAAMFDTASDGPEAEGWQLGANPTEDDLALALLDVPHLDGIDGIERSEVMPDGSAQSWPPKVRSTDLVILASDAVHIQFAARELV